MIPKHRSFQAKSGSTSRFDEVLFQNSDRSLVSTCPKVVGHALQSAIPG